MISKYLLRSLILIGSFYLLNQVPLYANEAQTKNNTEKKHHHHHHHTPKKSDTENLKTERSETKTATETQSSEKNQLKDSKNAEIEKTTKISQEPAQSSVDFSTSKTIVVLGKSDTAKEQEADQTKSIYEKSSDSIKYLYTKYFIEWSKGKFFPYITAAGVGILVTYLFISERSKALARRAGNVFKNFFGRKNRGNLDPKLSQQSSTCDNNDCCGVDDSNMPVPTNEDPDGDCHKVKALDSDKKTDSSVSATSTSSASSSSFSSSKTSVTNASSGTPWRVLVQGKPFYGMDRSGSGQETQGSSSESSAAAMESMSTPTAATIKTTTVASPVQSPAIATQASSSGPESSSATTEAMSSTKPAITEIILPTQVSSADATINAGGSTSKTSSAAIEPTNSLTSVTAQTSQASLADMTTNVVSSTSTTDEEIKAKLKTSAELIVQIAEQNARLNLEKQRLSSTPERTTNQGVNLKTQPQSGSMPPASIMKVESVSPAISSDSTATSSSNSKNSNPVLTNPFKQRISNQIQQNNGGNQNSGGNPSSGNCIVN